MLAPRSPALGHRFVRVRSDLGELDALIVTHLPNIAYLTGFTGSAGVLVLMRHRATLIVDFRYATAARTRIASQPDLVQTVSVVVADQNIDQTLVKVLEEEAPQKIGIESQRMSVARFNALSGTLTRRTSEPVPSLVPTERIVERARAVKDSDEITVFREAGRRLASAARELPELVQAGRSEREIAADVDALLRQHGFDRPAFDTIVASGPNAALPHARPTWRRVEVTDGVVLDFGGVYDGYCVDLTRTVQLGQAPENLREMFDAVAEAQRAAIAAIKPGVKASSVDRAARETLASHGLAAAFGHGTGHGLGLEVHEEPRIGRYSETHPDVVLEPGMVFTVEPGAYVEGFGGVRIEDDILVIDDGCEVLTR
jgi:Xaa-Pro aminopeptidase